MNTKTWSIILAVIGVNLGIGWLLTVYRAGQQEATAAARIAALSNDLAEVSSQLTLERKQSLLLQTNLVEQTGALGAYSNRWIEVTEMLSRLQTASKSAATVAEAEIEKRDQQITDLEGERDGLTQRMNGLTSEIGNLTGRISETERQLATSEGNREQLQRELRRLLVEKSDLERRFNDIASLRDQVGKLKEELNVSRRADRIRRGVYGMDKKGAQLLNEGIPRLPNAIAGTNLPVAAELGTDGSIRVTTPAIPPPQ